MRPTSKPRRAVPYRVGDGTSARRTAADGITLIEVVAGLALLGTLLASTLVASSAIARQNRVASEKRLAVATIDRFLVNALAEGRATSAWAGTSPRAGNVAISITEVGRIAHGAAVRLRVSARVRQADGSTPVRAWAEVVVRQWEGDRSADSLNAAGPQESGRFPASRRL